MNNTFTIAISKAKTNVEVDFNALPEVSKNYLIAYGLKQRLNDVHSQINAAEENAPALALALVEQAIKALQDGTTRVAGSRVTANPFEVYMMEQLRKALKIKSNKELVEKLEAKGVDIETAFSAFATRNGSSIEKERKAFEKMEKKAQSVSLDDLLV